MPSDNFSKKRGLGLRDFCNRFAIVLVEAPVELVLQTLAENFRIRHQTVLIQEPTRFIIRRELTDEFRARRDSNLFPPELNDRAGYVWQYLGHPWTVVGVWAGEEMAFTLALLLETRTLIVEHSGVVDRTTLKVFHEDLWIEHYRFGDDEDELGGKFHDRKGQADEWDVETVYGVCNEDSPVYSTRHLFKSAIRKISESEIVSILASEPSDEFEFLNTTLKFYDAYLPDSLETPFRPSRFGFESWRERLLFSQIHAVVFPDDQAYWDSLIPCPKRVACK